MNKLEYLKKYQDKAHCPDKIVYRTSHQQIKKEELIRSFPDVIRDIEDDKPVIVETFDSLQLNEQ